MLRTLFSALALLSLNCAAPVAAQEPEAWPAYAPQSFTRAYTALRRGCEADNGELWGVSLCRPLLVVHIQSRAVMTSEPGVGGLLQPVADGVWGGVLPLDVRIAVPPDSSVLEWAGVRWTIVESLYGDDDHLNVEMLGSAWRNIQDSIGIPAQTVQNPHLDTEMGRYYLRLEMRALTRALRAQGVARREAAIDALNFRAARHALYPDAVATEIIADRNDGLAFYTGARAGIPDHAERYAADWIEAQDGANGFTGFYAQLTGPAYGLMLDQERPNWRRELGSRSPADLLSRTLRRRDITADQLRLRGDVYGGESIGAEERQWTEVDQTITDMTRDQYTNWLRVELPLSPNAHVEFVSEEPRQIPLLGTFSTVIVRDNWGELRGAAVVTEDRTKVIVVDPMPGNQRGDGWEIALAPGYRIRETDYPNPYLLERSP